MVSDESDGVDRNHVYVASLSAGRAYSRRMSLAVLLVDDEPANDGPVRQALLASAPHATLLTARTGAQGLWLLNAALESGSQEIAAIFLDLALPAQPGIDVLRELRGRAETKTIPVVMLTRSTQEVDIWLSYKLGANAYLVKDPLRFPDQMAQATNFWCNHNLRLPTLAQ